MKALLKTAGTFLGAGVAGLLVGLICATLTWGWTTAAAIKIQTPLPLAIEYKQAPACAIVRTSYDLTNWLCVARLERCDGSTNPWRSISWSETADGSNQFWQVEPCGK